MLERRWAKRTLVALGIFGASLFYGDGMITPAISVLSAVEGLKVAAPSLEHLVVPITLVILTMLFAIQRYGTGAVGRAFGPIMGVWFAVIALGGLARVAEHPGILRTISPTYGITFFVDHGQRRLRRAGVGRAHDHGGRGPLRRHGALRRLTRSGGPGSSPSSRPWPSTTWARGR